MSKLDECAQRVIEEANTIWKELGLDEEQQSAKFSAFITSVERALESFLDGERAEIEKVRDDLQQKTRRIVQICESLGIDSPPLNVCGLALLKADAIVTECLGKYEKRYNDADKELKSLLKRYRQIKDQLGNVPKSDLENSMDLRDAHIKNVRFTLDSLICEREKRAEKVRKIAKEIISFCRDLGEDVPEDVRESESASADKINVTEDFIKHVSDLRDTYDEVYHARKNQIDTILRSIKQQYSRLNLPENEFEEFRAKVNSYDQRAMDLCTTELSRLFERRRREGRCLFQEKIKSVQSLWDILSIPADHRVLPETCVQLLSRDGNPEQSKQGAEQDDDALLDKALNDIDQLKDSLEESRREMNSLNEDIKKRETLVAERIKFDDEVQDSERFRRRGYDWKQELRNRKLYHETLPNLEEKLIVRLQRWNESRGSVFVYDGINYLEKLTEEHDEYIRQQQLQQQQKAKHLRTRSANDAKIKSKRAIGSRRRQLVKSMSNRPKKRCSEHRGRKRGAPCVVAVDVDEDEGKSAAKKHGVLGETLTKRMRRAEEENNGATEARRHRRPSKRTATKPTLWR